MKRNAWISLLGKGILVGTAAGFLAALYRMVLQFTGTALNFILDFTGRNPLLIAGWFLVLFFLAWTVGKIVAFEPAISGSGLPHLEAELTGKLDLNWRRIIPVKFAAGFLCLLGGLALGRAGPSIQLGAMAGKGISQKLGCSSEDEKALLVCGAGAGLSATFHAPLAGAVFSLEKICKKLSPAVFVSVIAASAAADLLASSLLGRAPIFSFDTMHALPLRYYWLLLILGVILGFMGIFYRWFTLKVQTTYKQITQLGATGRLMIPFLCAGVLAFTAPELLGSGHNLVISLTHTHVMFGTLIFILAGRFIFSALCFGSGAPGGIFFPILMLGSFIGGIFATAGVQFFGLEPIYVNHFVLFAMAGYFAAIIHAPLTGAILLFEMSGVQNQLLPLAVVSATAYAVSSFIRPKSLNDCLLERILR